MSTHTESAYAHEWLEQLHLELPKPETTQTSTRGEWCIHTMERHPAVKMNTLLVRAATRMNPNIIMLRERSLIKKEEQTI